MMLRREIVLPAWAMPAVVVVVLGICDLILLAPLENELQSWAAVGLAILLPGLLLVELLIGPRSDAGLGERFAYGVGAGLALLVLLMLALSYLPGGLSFTLVAASFNALTIALLAVTLFVRRTSSLVLRFSPFDWNFVGGLELLEFELNAFISCRNTNSFLF